MTDVLTPDRLPGYLRTAIDAGRQRARCPICHGGRSSEVSLSITPDDNGLMIRLKCFRASCGWYALLVTAPGASIHRKHVHEGRVYDDDMYPLGEELQARLVADYGLKLSIVRAHGWAEGHGGKLVMPVLGPSGEERGHMTRTFDEPKRCMSYKASAQPWLDWWRLPTKQTILVEDQISAARLACLGYQPIALMGTNLSIAEVQEISRHTSGTVKLALDPDAFEKSLHLTKRHSSLIMLEPVCLPADIKDIEDDDEIRSILT